MERVWVCVCWREFVCGCVFLTDGFLVIYFLKVLTIYDWLDIFLLFDFGFSYFVYLFVFLSWGGTALWLIWSSLMYYTTLLLLNIYLYRYTYFLYLILFFPFPKLTFKPPCLQYYIQHTIWFIFPFLHLCMNWEFVKMLSLSSLCKIYV